MIDLLNKPKDFAHGYRAYIRYQLKQYDEAILDLDKAIKLVKNRRLGLFLSEESKGLLFELYLYKSYIYRDTHKYKKAIETFKKCIQIQPNDSNVQSSLGFLYRDGLGVKQDYKKAFDWFLKAAEQNDSKAQSSLGFLYRDGLRVKQDYKKAFDWFVKAAEQNDADAQSSLGFLYRDGLGVEQDYKKALYHFDKAIELDEKNLYACGGRGDCNIALKNYKEAIKDFNKAIELDLEETTPWYYYLRAECKLELMLYEEALEDYKKASKLAENPEDKIQALLNIQYCLEETNIVETEEILNLCNEVLEKEENIPVLIYKAHCLLLLKKDYELIIEIILKVLEKDKKLANDDNAYELIAPAYLRLQNYPEAEKWAIKYTNTKPDEAAPFTLLLWIYAEQKQKEKAREILEICSQKDPGWQKRREYKAIVTSLDKLDQ